LPAVSILLLAALAGCASPAVEFEGRYWMPRIRTMEIDLADDSIPAGVDVESTIDFQDELGIDDANFPQGQFRWFTGPNSWIRAEYTPLAFDGDEVLEKAIEFGGQVYEAGTRVTSDLDIHYVRLGWGWQFLDLADGAFRAGTLLEAKGFYLDATLKTPDLDPDERISETETLAFALPTVGVVVDATPIEPVRLFGEISGLYAGSYGHFFDAEAGVKVIPWRYFTLTAGYRVVSVAADLDDDSADFTLDGFFVGGSLRF